MTIASQPIAAQAFNVGFYTVAATVIPVLFLAVAVQGPIFERVIKAHQAVTHPLPGAALIFSVPHPSSRWPRTHCGPASYVAAILVEAGLAEADGGRPLRIHWLAASGRTRAAGGAADAWAQVQAICREPMASGRTITTIDRGIANRILDVHPNAIVRASDEARTPDGQGAPVTRLMVERIWHNLADSGHASRISGTLFRWTTIGCVGLLALIAGDSVLPAHAPSHRAPRPAGLGRGAHSVSGIRDDRPASTTLLAESPGGAGAGSCRGRCWWRAAQRAWRPTSRLPSRR